MKVIDQVISESFALWNGDSSEVLKGLPSQSVDLSVFSPPFQSLFTYSPSERDLGNCKSPEEFWDHFGFISRELRRVIRPGRNICVHVQQLTSTKATHGVIGMIDFRGMTIQHFIKAGFIYHGEVCIDKDPQALRNGTPVLTPSGWKAINELRVGEYVIGGDGKPVEIIGVWPHERRTMYRVTFSDGVSVECDANHLWAVRPEGRKYQGSKNQWLTLRTDELYGNLHAPSGRPRYEIPMLTAPVEFDQPVDLPLHPYLLGAILGDGNISERSTVALTIEQELADQLPLPDGCNLRRLPGSDKDGGKVATFHIGHETWHVNPVLDALRLLGVQGQRAWEKHIPDPYLFASPQNRWELLRGLMDTDGTCKKNGTAFFATVSQRLAKDMVSLVQSLGGLTTVRIERPTYAYKGKKREGRTRYVITIRVPDCPFNLPRKAHRWHRNRELRRNIVAIEAVDSDECTCITVANNDGLFVTDHFVVTHNSQAIRTHSKSLLFVQLRKDSSWMRPALADYILVFRAPGDNAVPVHPDLTNDEWIEWARPIWYGIKESDTLNVAVARANDDERHIAPLQLGTIERCIRLWSNKGEVVLTPFAGIGSEVYQAVKLGRRGIGIELKPEYFKTAIRNIREAERLSKSVNLFDFAGVTV